MEDNRFFILGLGLLGLAIMIYKKDIGDAGPPIPKYSYDVTVNMTDCKHWQYIEPIVNKIILNDGDAIRINLTLNSSDIIDVVEIRFYNICSNLQQIGKMYAWVDNKPSLPTIGPTNISIPMYLATPVCPDYGTHKMDIWDTQNETKTGLTKFEYVYHGNPVTIKTLELYIVKKLG